MTWNVSAASCFPRLSSVFAFCLHVFCLLCFYTFVYFMCSLLTVESTCQEYSTHLLPELKSPGNRADVHCLHLVS